VGWILALWTLAVAVFSRNLPPSFASRVIGVLGIVSFCFLLFTLYTSNPFERLPPDQIPADGRDLNPVLQDPALAIHPPLLYTGYVGFAVAFAFACAAMLEGRLDQAWARWTRPWTTLAWCFLSVGIALGSWWAYYELGWGGYWFWDPVENASFMPWLVGTALIIRWRSRKTRTVQELDAAARDPRVLAELVGNFLVRSGVLVSVHSFAADPERWHVHPGVPGAHDRRRADVVQLARTVAEIAGRIRCRLARSLPALQQHRAGAGRAGGLHRHAGAARQRSARHAVDFGRAGLVHALPFPYIALALVVAGVRRAPLGLEAGPAFESPTAVAGWSRAR
jgi:ABC-type transport system involved in cytochrome c biogenesis permease subunit